MGRPENLPQEEEPQSGIVVVFGYSLQRGGPPDAAGQARRREGEEKTPSGSMEAKNFIKISLDMESKLLYYRKARVGELCAQNAMM